MAGPGPSYDQVVAGCERVIRGLVDCGLVGDGSDQQLTPSAPRSPAPRRRTANSSMHFRSSGPCHGVEMTADDFSSRRTREVCSEALGAHRTEVDMTRTSSEATDSERAGQP